MIEVIILIAPVATLIAGLVIGMSIGQKIRANRDDCRCRKPPETP